MGCTWDPRSCPCMQCKQMQADNRARSLRAIAVKRAIKCTYLTLYIDHGFSVENNSICQAISTLVKNIYKNFFFVLDIELHQSSKLKWTARPPHNKETPDSDEPKIQHKEPRKSNDCKSSFELLDDSLLAVKKRSTSVESSLIDIPHLHVHLAMTNYSMWLS